MTDDLLFELVLASVPVVVGLTALTVISIYANIAPKRKESILEKILKILKTILIAVSLLYLFAGLIFVFFNTPLFVFFIIIAFVSFSLFSVLYIIKAVIQECKKSSAGRKNSESYSENDDLYNSYEEYEENRDCDKNDAEEYNAHIPCLICGNDAGNKHFCTTCYHKHKDHDIIVKISKCKTATVEEKYAEGQRYTCKDGHIVRSKSEREIDNFLFDHKIFHIYEKKLDVNEQEYINPDFYLPKSQIYIEHWGLNSDEYKREKEYKLEIYKQKNLTVISTYEEDMTDIEFNLKRKLKNVIPNQINYLK